MFVKSFLKFFSEDFTLPQGSDTQPLLSAPAGKFLPYFLKHGINISEVLSYGLTPFARLVWRLDYYITICWEMQYGMLHKHRGIFARFYVKMQLTACSTALNSQFAHEIKPHKTIETEKP